MTAFRCSVAATARGDALAGTASTVRAFLLLEEAGPWGRTAWRDARLPEGLGAEVTRRSASAGVRPLLIRQDSRRHQRVRRLFTAYVDPAGPAWVEAGEVDDPRAVLDLDLDGLGAGRTSGLDRWAEPVFAVCVHGRHDTCCAERGRPVLHALTDAEPEATWGVSHIGGDRYAGNLLVLPGGLYYGRLDPARAVTVAAQFRSGHLDLDRLRGRSCWPMPVQAAEIALRRRLEATALEAVRLVGHTGDPDRVTARFATDRGMWEVGVEAVRSAPTALTCHAGSLSPDVHWTPRSIRPSGSTGAPVG